MSYPLSLGCSLSFLFRWTFDIGLIRRYNKTRNMMCIILPKHWCLGMLLSRCGKRVSTNISNARLAKNKIIVQVKVTLGVNIVAFVLRTFKLNRFCRFDYIQLRKTLKTKQLGKYRITIIQHRETLRCTYVVMERLCLTRMFACVSSFWCCTV